MSSSARHSEPVAIQPLSGVGEILRSLWCCVPREQEVEAVWRYSRSTREGWRSAPRSVTAQA
jgi:hypothetical protein